MTGIKNTYVVSFFFHAKSSHPANLFFLMLILVVDFVYRFVTHSLTFLFVPPYTLNKLHCVSPAHPLFRYRGTDLRGDFFFAGTGNFR